MNASRPQSVLDRSLPELDPDVAGLVGAGLARQRDTLEMIASENVAPLGVHLLTFNPIS